MIAGRIVLGLPELRRLSAGEKLTIRIRPGTTALEISLSLIAKGNMRLPAPADPIEAAFADLIGRLGPKR